MSTATKPDVKKTDAPSTPPPLGIAADEWQLLRSGDHPEPHRVLGAHPAEYKGQRGVVVRAFHPDAVSAELLVGGRVLALGAAAAGGLFSVFVPNASVPLKYQLRFHFADGASWERDDPYRFLPTVGDLDLHLFNEGTHRRTWEWMGGHARAIDGVHGAAFAVWAPTARRVSVVGDFCNWDGRLLPMRRMGASGVFELFVPGVPDDALYKFEIKTADGNVRLKSDPYAQAMELPPGTAARLHRSKHKWTDAEWLKQRAACDHRRAPIAIYEVHLGSWARVPEDGNRMMTYREIAPRLCEHVKKLGFNYIELLPISEYPFGGSWGYQVTGYYAPTARHGTPDDFREFVDICHQHGIGVILDWVAAHFCKDDFALRRFDGTAVYEHEDPRRGEHPDWGTLIFNYGRNEVKNFLLANALYWCREFHLDGLRVDAVASMLYLDYSRKHDEWLPNQWGGKENVDAIHFLRTMNELVHEEFPGVITVAEESTSWAGVTSPTSVGGLGFTFKWNMGWMHDTLMYFSKDPVHRQFHQNDLTFSMIYEHTERFINPLSHDEIVHGKRSLLEKMPGDDWQRFANLRLLLAYLYTRPGKKLLFMGTELAPYNEWYYETSLDWHLADDPFRVGLSNVMQDVGGLYLRSPSLWRSDPDNTGFAWISCDDFRNSVLSYVRRSADDIMVVVLNFTPVPRFDYRIGAPYPGRYKLSISTDDRRYAGSGFDTGVQFDSEPIATHGFPHSLKLALPPLAAMILVPA